MKKIYIKEDRIKSISDESRLLPKHLYSLLSTHTTSLGDNKAFPVDDDYPFDYTVVKQRFIEVSDALDSLGLESTDNDSLVTELSSLVTRCKEMEEPIRDFLEKLCENVINKIFSIPDETINLTCKLVGKIKPEKPVRVLPEPIGSDTFKFKNVDDIKLSKDAVAKRRFINSLIQGAAYTYANDTSFYEEELDKVNNELIPLYERIRIINDYLLFSKKDNITNDNIMQGSYVETKVGVSEDRGEIKSQGIIFPLLLQETIKGFFEIFSVHGLPSDRRLANYIIKKADFIKAEPWDMRFGVILWRKIFGTVEDTNVIPYAFTELIEMPCDEFNLSLNEILSSTDRGDEIMDTILRKSYNDNDYQEFKNSIVKRNLDKSIISDGYFSAAELDGFDIDDTSINDIITDDNENEEETIFEIVANDSTSDVELDVDDLIQNNEKFKEWFSENGLTDENGNPLLVYHGSGKDFSAFDINTTYDGKICFSPNKKDAICYTHWDNGDDNWRTINDAYQYLNDEGYVLNNKLGYPEKMNLLNMVNGKTGKPIDKQHAYDVIYEFYNEQYKNPTLYYCFIRNAEENEYYGDEYNVYDNDDIWVVKKERINYKPMPKLFGDDLNTYIE